MSMAEHTDEQEGMREIARNIREMLAQQQAERAWNLMSKTEKYAELEAYYNHTNFPHATKHILYQNILMDLGYTCEQRMEEAKNRYVINKLAKVGDTINCPGCNSPFIKKSYQHAFCNYKAFYKSSCKDFCNNWFSPKRLQRMVDYLKVK